MDSGTSRSEEAAEITAAFDDDVRLTEYAGSGAADGTRNGVALHVEWKRRSQVARWSVESTGGGPRLLADVRRRLMGEQGAIASGAIVQLTTGDASFDREWLLEGGPRARVLLVFDQGVRHVIAPARDMSLHVDEGKVSAGVNGTQFCGADIVRGINAVVAVRARLEALAESSAEDPQQKIRDDAEIAALRLKQKEIWARASVPARIGIVVFCGVLAVALVSGVFYGCGINTLFGM